MPRKKRVESICYDCLIRLAFEGLSTAIILTDEKCRLIFVNRAAHDVFGVSSSDVGRPIQQVLSDFSLLALWSEACQRDEPVMGLVKVTAPKERLLRVTVGICRTRRGTLIGTSLVGLRCHGRQKSSAGGDRRTRTNSPRSQISVLR